MRRGVWLAGAALVLSSSVALARPESLLPDLFSDPTPAPSPAPGQSGPPGPASSATPGGSAPVVQPLPGIDGSAPYTAEKIVLPAGFPSIGEIEDMSADELDTLFGLSPKYDIPPAARRATERIGLLASSEGGLPVGSLAKQPVGLVRAAIAGTKGPLVSRWGHILLRRALASRLDAPAGMDPVDFAAMRAALLLRLGEADVARALVQDIDSANYNSALTDAAFDSYVATGDLTGMCPVARLSGDIRKDPQWQLVRSICRAYTGDASVASRELDRALGSRLAPEIDIRLAQRYAGAAGEGRRAVNIEWDGVEQLSPWRWSLSTALGVEVPAALRDKVEPAIVRWTALSSATPLALRAEAADLAAREGILSSAAMVDLYAQIYGENGIEGPSGERAALLREAYLGETPVDRLAAIKALWGKSPDYGRQVMTAYAAARLPVQADLAVDAPGLIAAMLSAGLDRNALRWSSVLAEGSQGWAQLALVRQDDAAQVSSGALDSFIDADDSAGHRKSQFLLAGLAGLGRVDQGNVADAGNRVGVNLARQTKWSRLIDRAAELDNQALVALLAGVGMQGDGWDKMTARHLYHIVRALDRVGLSAEARMIAAEAVARG